MSNITQRINFINSLLAQLGPYRALLAGQTSVRIFELYCYFRKAEELMNRGKLPIPQNIRGNVFSPHAKPGNAGSASYISFSDQAGETLDLFLNVKFQGLSNVYHSPDIVLKASKNDQIVSVYECKNHHGKLGLGIYREFIGYCEEMNMLVRGNRNQKIRTLRNSYPELRPCIYTSAVTNKSHKSLMERYDFSVIDGL